MIRVIYKEQIQRLREENNTTQITIANVLKIGKSCYSQYENEERIIPLKYINEISNFYNVSIDYIFGFNKSKKYSNSKTEINQILSGKRLKEFQKAYNYNHGVITTVIQDEIKKIYEKVKKEQEKYVSQMISLIINAHILVMI